MTDQVDAAGFFVLDRRASVTLHLRGVSGIKLEGDASSIISHLIIRRLDANAPASDQISCGGPTAGDIEVTFDTSVGLYGSIFAKELEFEIHPLQGSFTPVMKADRLDRNELMYAVIDRDAAVVAERLKAGDDVNHQEKAGWTALHFGAQNNDSMIVRILLEASADHKLRDKSGNTALSTAVFSYNNGPKCISTLLSAGADPDTSNHYRVSPRSLAYSIGNYDTAKFFPDA